MNGPVPEFVEGLVTSNVQLVDATESEVETMKRVALFVPQAGAALDQQLLAAGTLVVALEAQHRLARHPFN
jgi:hypothetical protein